jgi:exocyst complex protein 7
MEAMAAARDAVRCVEHAMIVIAGEKNVYRTIVTPALAKTEEEAAEEEDEGEVQVMSPYYRKACVGTYSYVVGAIVDRALDVIETVFLKEGGIGQTSGKDGSTNNALSVTAAAAAAAAGLRMLDGVRMLGPSLAKLCEMPVNDGHTDASSSIASVLCIAIHRATVKNTARTLENLAKAIQEDPNKGPLHRPKDASVSVVSADTVKAIRSVSPFMSAYRSVSKRRALPWDPNMGEEAGEMDSFVRYLIMRLLNSLKGKALDYTRDGRDDSQAKANIFMINNAFYLLEELGPNNMPETLDDETYRISGSWFVDKVTKMMESETTKYVAHWEALNTHLTAVDTNELEYKKDGVTLSHDSGRLIKQRFSGFNEAFKLTWDLHKSLCVIDPRLRLQVQQGVSGVFLPRYRRFFEKYKK